MDSRTLRRDFLDGLLTGLRVVWPILSAQLILIVSLGLVVGLLEGWSVQESIEPVPQGGAGESVTESGERGGRESCRALGRLFGSQTRGAWQPDVCADWYGGESYMAEGHIVAGHESIVSQMLPLIDRQMPIW